MEMNSIIINEELVERQKVKFIIDTSEDYVEVEQFELKQYPKTFVFIDSIAVILFFLAQFSEELPIETIDNLPKAEQTTITGEVQSVRTSDNVIFLKIQGNKIITTDVIVFNDEPIFIEKGNRVTVSGQVEEYKGKKEIIASSITLS